MTTPRFFIEPKYINEQDRTVFCQDAKLSKQIRKVLRLGNGDKVDVLDSQDNIYHCLLQIHPRQARDLFQAQIESQEKLASQSKTQIIVGLPLIKINRFEWALEKLTELGVDIIVPIALERSIIKLPSKTANGGKNHGTEYKSKFTRWQKIIQEASEQCERPTPPQLVPPLRFQDWLEQYFAQKKSPQTLRLICAERQNVQSLEIVLYNQKTCPQSCAIALGAEGGFTEEEIKLALAHHFIPVSLGPLILRTETAAVYTLVIVNALIRLIQTDPSR